MVLEWIGNTVIAIGIIFMCFGVFGMFKFKEFYFRYLVTSKIDIVGTFTIIFGLIIRHGISFFSGKLLVILVIMMILNPLVSHIVARSAYLSDHEVEK